MPLGDTKSSTVDRRRFVQATLIPISVPITARLIHSTALGAESSQGAAPVENPPSITDTNVHLFDWPFRKLKHAQTSSLIARLQKHRIEKAWAGSFDAVLNKQLDRSNQRLSEECAKHGHGMLVPFGSVNPAWPDWEEDLRRCHEKYKMPGVRLYPAYHGYALDHPELANLLVVATQRKMIVQIALRMEDERVHHVALNIPPINLAPLSSRLKAIPQARVQLINSAGPLIGDSLGELVRDTNVAFDIAATEGNGGVGRLIAGSNPSYRGAIPSQRLLFGSHAPFFPCQSAVMKLFESPLSLEQLKQIMYGNARQFLGSNQ
ncbi:MAG: metal-dependent hydrolase [Planctomycetes bacterium]|nr:metal-dependent hydrolase [Planctomycetota bacterium]